jgi:large subunit ribosomal protein L11
MAKVVMVQIKLQCPGAGHPAPPVGPALGQHGVNIGEFVKRFNDRTKDQPGMVLPVVITVFKDKSFDFVVKSPPASVLLQEGGPARQGRDQPRARDGGEGHEGPVIEIVKLKMNDLNAATPEAGARSSRAPPAPVIQVEG